MIATVPSRYASFTSPSTDTDTTSTAGGVSSLRGSDTRGASGCSSTLKTPRLATSKTFLSFSSLHAFTHLLPRPRSASCQRLNDELAAALALGRFPLIDESEGRVPSNGLSENTGASRSLPSAPVSLSLSVALILTRLSLRVSTLIDQDSRIATRLPPLPLPLPLPALPRTRRDGSPGARD